MAVNIWTPQGQLVGLTARCNPNVIYEGNAQVLSGTVFKMWCGVNNGTTGIWYYESANGLTSWTGAAGNPIVTGTGRSFPTVYHIGSTYYLYTNAFPSATAITVQTSSDGITWGSATAAIANTHAGLESTGIAQLNIVPGTPGYGTNTGETYYGYYEAVGSGGSVEILVTSTDLLNWTKTNGVTAAFTATAPLCFQKIDGIYYAWGPHNAVSSQLFTQGGGMAGFSALCRWSALLPTGPWTLLPLPGAPSAAYGAGVMYPTLRADFDVSGTSSNTVGTSISDPCMVSALGNMYAYWTRSTNEVNNQYGINAAVATSCTPTQQVAGYEGMVGFPLPLFDGNLNVVGSDPGTGANANPIGGNWTHLLAGLDAQRSNNLIEAGAAAGNGIIYWNQAVGSADEWSEITVHNMISTAFIGPFVRMSVTGANTDYQSYWKSANIGSAGTAIIAGTLSGVAQGPYGTLVGLKVSVGDTLMLAISGNTNILLYYCGFPILGGVVTGNISTGAPGLWCNSTAAVTDTQVSAWRGGIFAAFTAYGISGSAGVAGAIVSYVGTVVSGTVTADGSGNYAITGLFPDTYIITPSKTNYTFAPTTLSKTITTASITGANFTAAMSGGGFGGGSNFRYRF